MSASRSSISSCGAAIVRSIRVRFLRPRRAPRICGAAPRRKEPPRFADALSAKPSDAFAGAGIASFELADDFEAIGRAFESEAEQLEAAPQSRWRRADALEHSSPPGRAGRDYGAPLVPIRLTRGA